MKEEKDEGEGEGEGAIVTTDPLDEKKEDDAFPTMIRKRGRPRKVIQESHPVLQQQQQQQHIEETKTTPPLESEGKSKKQKECRINPLPPPPTLESKSKKEKQTNSTVQEVPPNKSSSTCKQTHVLRREGSRRKGEPRRAAAD